MSWKKAVFVFSIIFLMGLLPVYQLFSPFRAQTDPAGSATDLTEEPELKSMESAIEPGETLFAIFQRYGLSIDDLFAMKQAAASVHKLHNIRPGQAYRLVVDDNNCVNAFTYSINENTVLKIERQEEGFTAVKCETPYETRVLTLSGQIDTTLVGALGASREDMGLAMSISDILAWDIDFNVDLRRGDSFRIITEGLYLNGEFKRYGSILALEFVNDQRMYKAYLFSQNGRADYFDANGRSLRKAFLKAPLSFRRISSSFASSRRHPILKISRPHHGIDYAAPSGTPVSATADGRISFIGSRGEYGKLIIVSHRNGLQTYYGHLSKFATGMSHGKNIQQGDLIGHVGMTGLATGPHLHYEMRKNGVPINPARLQMAAGPSVEATRMDDFRNLTKSIDHTFVSASFHDAKDIHDARLLALKADELPFSN